jgi:hypothetical protein
MRKDLKRKEERFEEERMKEKRSEDERVLNLKISPSESYRIENLNIIGKLISLSRMEKRGRQQIIT